VDPAHAGYFAVAPTVLPAPASTVPAPEVSESGIRAGEALAVTGLALLASLFLTLGMRGQQVDRYDTALRKGLVYTLFFYLVLGAALGCYVVARRVRLVWHRGSPLAALALGVPVGVLGGSLAVLLNSALRGRLAGDPNMELLVGGGGALRIFVALVVTSVLAPLVEETVFRGICAGSLRNAAAGLWLSALAFAIWHMHPTALRYYAIMGLLLGRLWQKRGLLASMSTHACFNGVLTVAAIAATTGAATYADYGPLRFQLPGGWHAAGESTSIRAYQGPAGASLAFLTTPTPTGRSAEQVVESLQRSEGQTTGFSLLPGSERVVAVHGVDAVVADVTVQAQPGHLLVVPVGTTLYNVVVITGGSPSGERDWNALARSLEVAPQG
jgi:membrane protease YdiL (CAAX protease family)